MAKSQRAAETVCCSCSQPITGGRQEDGALVCAACSTCGRCGAFIEQEEVGLGVHAGGPFCGWCEQMHVKSLAE